MKLNKTQKKYRKVMNKMARQGKIHDRYGAKIKHLDWKIDEQQAKQDAKVRQYILTLIVVILGILLIEKYELKEDIMQWITKILEIFV